MTGIVGVDGQTDGERITERYRCHRMAREGMER